MMQSRIELALGTVQFGMAYGVAGRGEPVPAHEVHEILARAWSSGIRVLDTAPGYGDIEERLADLVDTRPFDIVSKIPALPHSLSADGVAMFVSESVHRSCARLRGRLSTVLFHRGEDLEGPHGETAWRAASAAAATAGVRLGVSCYSPAEAAAIFERFPIAVAQVPGNAFDQRLASATGLEQVELHVRSVFLQGLLMLSRKDASERLPCATAAIHTWKNWCLERNLSPLQAALGIAKGLPGARYCVVGVDRAAHLDEILQSWEEVGPLQAATLSIDDEHVIDPRRW